MMDISFHYPPELFQVLIDALPKLCKSKNDLLLFFQGAGASKSLLDPYQRLLKTDKAAFNKYHVTRELLAKLNEQGEHALRVRRELLKRVVEFDDFSVCWENDRAAARGLVAQIRDLVNVKDSFTRMRIEKDEEKRQRVEQQQAAVAEKLAQEARREKVKSEPDCRNRTLHKMFRFVGVGEQAGTGIPKILHGWQSQHWSPPKLYDTAEPYNQTLIELRMTDLFPAPVMVGLKARFGERFEGLSYVERVALALAASEGTVNHSRLKGVTTEHPVDLSRVLQHLTQAGMLESTRGRGAVYHLPGEAIPTPEDIFGTAPTISAPSSPNLAGSSPNLADQRDPEGCLLSDQLLLPIIDDLARLSAPTRHRLEGLAAEPRSKGKVSREKMIEVVLALCAEHFITLRCLAELVNRKPDTLRDQYLTVLVQERKLSLAFPKTPTHERHPTMENPTLVVLTDRNDLDDQLFATFARCRDLLRQPPVQAADRADLRAKLAVASGGVVFTTIQKFFPEERGDRHPVLSDRRNIVVIADEAHRSQYDFINGFARHMRDALPNASFIGFTGTPIEQTDANTRAVFGDYISVYDIQRAVIDGATVPIYYESRLAKLELKETERPKIDPEFEEATEGEEVERKEKLKSRWAQLEAVVGSENRIRLVARDLVDHFENRLATLDGKAMVVCMSRRICVELYREIAALRPEWGADADEQGAMKVVMTGSATDPLPWQQHIRNKKRREDLALRFREPKDPFRIVIVRDMWLTGFDAPSLHTMYVDKPMRGHGLMQAIARVNRVFKDKPGGLVVDYLGLADELKKALATYTESGGTGKTAIDQAEAVAVMLEKYEICLGLFHGFDWSKWISGTPQDRLSLLPAAQEHILGQDDGKARLLRAVTELGQAFALAVPHEDALKIRDDVGFFQAVRAVLAKGTPGEQKTDEELEHAIRQIISRAVVSEGVIDIFAAAGLKKPDISILSDEFLAEVQGMPQRNLAVELLQKLLKGEIKARSKRNVVQARSFADMLEQSVRKYQNRAIETAQVIEELIQLAKDMRAASARGEALKLSEDKLAFYDALEVNDSAVKVLGEPTLVKIARELVETVKRNVTIDWTVRENVRAQLRVIVKRILRKYGYPPDKQEKATQTVLEQAALLSQDWALA